MQALRGFTRVELLVCLGILSVLGAAGAYGWQGYIPDYRLSATVRDLYTVMQAARIFSIRENTEVAVVLPGGNRCEAFVDDGAGPAAAAGNGVREAGERLVCKRSFSAGVAICKITFQAGRLRFNSRGMPRGAGSFYLKNGAETYLGISVSVSGALSVKKSTDGGKTWERL